MQALAPSNKLGVGALLVERARAAIVDRSCDGERADRRQAAPPECKASRRCRGSLSVLGVQVARRSLPAMAAFATYGRDPMACERAGLDNDLPTAKWTHSPRCPAQCQRRPLGGWAATCEGANSLTTVALRCGRNDRGRTNGHRGGDGKAIVGSPRHRARPPPS